MLFQSLCTTAALSVFSICVNQSVALRALNIPPRDEYSPLARLMSHYQGASQAGPQNPPAYLVGGVPNYPRIALEPAPVLEICSCLHPRLTGASIMSVVRFKRCDARAVISADRNGQTCDARASLNKWATAISADDCRVNEG